MLVTALSRAIIAASVSIVGTVSDASAEPASHYVRNTDSSTVVVFVHGVLGDAEETWVSEGGAWPEMLSQDSVFGNADIFVFQYPTNMWATMSIDELAEHMRLQLAGHGVTPRQNVVFLVHSMGGLVTRAYLLKNRDVAESTRLIYFFSTPTTGSEVATMAGLLSQNPQFTKMQPMKAEDYLADLQRNWLNADFNIPSYCAYEKRRTYGWEVVTIASASVLCNKRLDPIDADHSSIVKPSGPTDVPYLAFKTAYQEEMNVSRGLPSEVAQMEFDELLADLNRTLMWNRDELFPRIDAYIADPSEERWRMVRSSAVGLLEQIQGAVSRAMQFDSRFFEQGNRVLLITGDARRETVDRTYYQPFQEARQGWGERAVVVERVTEYRDMPSREQAVEWRDDLARHYDRLQVELQRLLLLGQEPT